MLGGQPDAEFHEGLGRDRVALDQRVEFLGPVEALHPHRPVDGLTLAIDSETSWGTHDAGQAEIERRREAAVDPQLLLAEVLSQLPCREIQEVEPDRLLDLVREAADEEHPGDVGLDQRHLPRGAGPGAGDQQCVRQLRGARVARPPAHA